MIYPILGRSLIITLLIGQPYFTFAALVTLVVVFVLEPSR